MKIKAYSQQEIIDIFNMLPVRRLPNGFYNYQGNIHLLIRHMIFTELKWNRDEICKNINHKIFKNYKLGGIFFSTGKGLYDIIDNCFPEMKIKPWELLNSSVGPNFWGKESNLSDLKNWLLEKLIEEVKIKTIRDASSFGLRKLVKRYNVSGLINVKFESSEIKFFEFLFDSKYEKVNNEYTFHIVSDLSIPPSEIYSLQPKFYELDDRGKTLIKEISRFCLDNKRFPNEKDMTLKSGYISRTQYYKYFNTENFGVVRDYIKPNEDPIPETFKCVKCKIIKKFNTDNFNVLLLNKFGLTHTCKECNKLEVVTRYYKKKGIIFEKYDDISPEEWCKYKLNRSISKVPNFCLTNENIIKMLRYYVYEHLKLRSKEQVCDERFINVKQLKIDGMYEYYYTFESKLSFLQKCFTEYHITDADVARSGYSDETSYQIISDWMNKNGLSNEDLLRNYGLKNLFNKKIAGLISARFKGRQSDAFLWYLNYNRSELHLLELKDLENKPNNFWKVKENRIEAIQEYCIKQGILEAIDNTKSLKTWIRKNFTQNKINTIMTYTVYYSSLYELLTEAFPEILSNKILFDWEWHQFNKSDEFTLTRILRELVNYRLDSVIKDIQRDIPIYINHTYLMRDYIKITKHISRGRFKNYYEWCSKAFPECKWTPVDFGLVTANDGTLLNSSEEKLVYEFIKYNQKIDKIKAVGLQKSGDNIFRVDNGTDKYYCPDFIIERDGASPVIIEYFGLYNSNHNHPTFKAYREKTERKCAFYSSLKDIEFIALYPHDLKNNCRGIQEKIESMLNRI